MALNSAPNRWSVDEIHDYMSNSNAVVETGFRITPARPYGFFGLASRLKLAWAVFTGEADALFWPGQTPPKAF